jgi:hypothetical protein
MKLRVRFCIENTGGKAVFERKHPKINKHAFFFKKKKKKKKKKHALQVKIKKRVKNPQFPAVFADFSSKTPLKPPISAQKRPQNRHFPAKTAPKRLFPAIHPPPERHFSNLGGDIFVRIRRNKAHFSRQSAVFLDRGV